MINKATVEEDAERLARKSKVALAGGQMISAAFAFLGELFPEGEASEQTVQAAEMFKRKLSEGMERCEDGKLKMTISFPDESALDNLATNLARMLGTGKTVV